MSNTLTKLDYPQTLRGAFDDATFAFKMRNVSQMVPSAFDSIAASYPTSSSEVYAYYTGGLSGTLVATLTVTYTDSTKAVLTSVVRT